MSWRRSTFRLPTLLALLGFSGLFAALLGDGWWDALAWAGLALPACLSLWALPRRRGRTGAKSLPNAARTG